LYQAEMAVIPNVLPSEGINTDGTQPWDIVGAICETGDFLAKDRLLSLATGDILAITGAGAYGFTMSSNYNSRPRASEAMVAGSHHQLIRKRETTEALYADEMLWQNVK